VQQYGCKRGSYPKKKKRKKERENIPAVYCIRNLLLGKKPDICLLVIKGEADLIRADRCG